MEKGLYRAHNDKLGEECARIDMGDDKVELFMARKAYIARGCEPAFDDLPTLDDYKANKG